MITEEQKNIAEEQIVQQKEPLAFDTREYPIEVLITKFTDGEFEIPSYQRYFVWEKDKEKMSKFIESVLLDLPIPYIYFADAPQTGKLEIIDGSQRIRTLKKFFDNGFKLQGLEVLDKLNGFKFKDLLESRQRRFLRKTIRSIELTEKASSNVRRDLFARINVKPYALTPMEVRKGLYEGPFYDFLVEDSRNPKFQKLCPISSERIKRGENQELVLRYYAYCDNYKEFVHSVEDFLDDYMKNKHENGFDKEAMQLQFQQMLDFVEAYFPDGFKKSLQVNSVSRVRFEAISVGVTLALRINPKIEPKKISEWIECEEFQNITASGSANNKSKVTGRVEYVRDALLNEL